MSVEIKATVTISEELEQELDLRDAKELVVMLNTITGEVVKESDNDLCGSLLSLRKSVEGVFATNKITPADMRKIERYLNIVLLMGMEADERGLSAYKEIFAKNGFPNAIRQRAMKLGMNVKGESNKEQPLPSREIFLGSVAAEIAECVQTTHNGKIIADEKTIRSVMRILKSNHISLENRNDFVALREKFKNLEGLDNHARDILEVFLKKVEINYPTIYKNRIARKKKYDDDRLQRKYNKQNADLALYYKESGEKYYGLSEEDIFRLDARIQLSCETLGGKEVYTINGKKCSLPTNLCTLADCMRGGNGNGIGYFKDTPVYKDHAAGISLDRDLERQYSILQIIADALGIKKKVDKNFLFSGSNFGDSNVKYNEEPRRVMKGLSYILKRKVTNVLLSMTPQVHEGVNFATVSYSLSGGGISSHGSSLADAESNELTPIFTEA